MKGKIFVHLADGFEEMEAFATIDVLRRAEFDTVIVSVTGNKLVRSVRDVGVVCDNLFEEVDYKDCEMIVLPGGIPGVPNMGAHKGLCEKLREFSDDDNWIAAICAAPIILHEQGLLNGRTITCFPGVGDDFHEAIVLTDKVVVDRNLITSQGPGTAIEFGLKIVEILKDKETADYIRSRLLA